MTPAGARPLLRTAGTAAFAARLRRRHGRGDRATSGVPRILARMPAALVMRTVRLESRSLWAPRLALTVALDDRPGMGPSVAAPALAPAGAVRRREVVRVTERLLARAVRQEPGTPGAQPATPTTAPAVPTPTALPPLARVLARALRPAVAVPSPAAGAPALPAEPAVARAWPATPSGDPRPAAAVPAVDVERLTDRVVQALGRRVNAHRERLGR